MIRACATIIAILTSPLLLVGLAHQGPAARDVTVTCHGAAMTVSGSMFEVNCGGSRLLVDCGADYGAERQLAQTPGEAPANQPPTDPRQLSTVLLTHAHLDHVGRLPELLENGFAGRILATPVTCRLLEPMLEMQLSIHVPGKRTFRWTDRVLRQTSTTGAASTGSGEPLVVTVHSQACRWASQISSRNLQSHQGTWAEVKERLGQAARGEHELTLCRECRTLETAKVMRLVHEVPFLHRTPVAAGIQAEFLPAGHIPGSASICLDFAVAEGHRTLLFSGDLGNPWSPLQKGPEPCPKVDALFVETTYGNTVRGDVLAEQRDFRIAVGKALADGRLVWIPAFALDRTQRVLQQIDQGRREGRINADAEVLAPSPTAAKIAQVYRSAALAGGTFYPALADLPFLQPLLASPRGQAQLPQPIVDRTAGPRILVTTSGMMDAGASRALLEELLSREDVTVILVGYADPTTEAGRLSAGMKELRLSPEQTITVRAEIRQFGAFSAHADAADLDRWMINISKTTPTFLVHGESHALQARADQLRGQGRTSVRIPSHGESLRPFP